MHLSGAKTLAASMQASLDSMQMAVERSAVAAKGSPFGPVGDQLFSARCSGPHGGVTQPAPTSP